VIPFLGALRPVRGRQRMIGLQFEPAASTVPSRELGPHPINSNAANRADFIGREYAWTPAGAR
jgi:hypothetical protein